MNKLTISLKCFSAKGVRYLDGVFLIDLRLDSDWASGIPLFSAEGVLQGTFRVSNGVCLSFSHAAVSSVGSCFRIAVDNSAFRPSNKQHNYFGRSIGKLSE